MNYVRVYQLIIQSTYDGAKLEEHHIIPRSLGGTNDAENLVTLSPRAHFVCHILLARMCEGEAKSKMTFALWRMAHSRRYPNRLTSKQYEILKLALSQAVSDNMKKRIATAVHHFSNSEFQREIGRKSAQKRIKDGTFHFLGSSINQKRIDDGTHLFLDHAAQRSFSERGNKKRWENHVKRQCSYKGVCLHCKQPFERKCRTPRSNRTLYRAKFCRRKCADAFRKINGENQ